MYFINGKWKQANGVEFDSINPATGEKLWTGREAVVDEVDAAVQSACNALPSWKKLRLEERSECLFRFRQQLEEHKTSLVKSISEEVGKPLWDAATEVQAMINKLDVTLTALKERRSPTEINIPGGIGATRYKPHGTVAVYGPFNFPGHIANGQIIPALAAGNTVVFKPSPLTPRFAEEMVKLWEHAELPAGVLNLIQGGRSTGEMLAKHRDVNGIFFTGSLQAGIALRKTVLEQPEKILVLELGGNNPLVIHRPHDVAAAVYWTIQSAFVTGGQRCTCARRLIVTDGNEPYLKALADAINRIQVGQPDQDPQPFYGSLISVDAVDHVLIAQRKLLKTGAVSIVEAKRLGFGRAFISPGLIDVTNCTGREDHEVFGPFLQLMRVPDLNAAIAEANETQFGLATALFTENHTDFETFYEEVHAGLINWNRPTTGASGALPFGGVGRSGNHRPAGSFAVDFCNIPIASLESPTLSVPEQLSPGVSLA